jgi:hypothetical protein
MRVLTYSGALLAGVLTSPISLAMPCALDEVPGASLLIPYFSVSACPSDSSPPSRDTQFELINTAAAPVLNQVTIWSNAGVPVFNFEVYLAGYSRQSISMADLLCNGTLPSTGSGISPHGPASDPAVSLPGCNDGTDPGNGAPVFGGAGAISLQDRQTLQAELQGMAGTGGSCAALPNAAGNSEGYITVDSVTACTDFTPADSDFYSILAFENVLTGDFSLIDQANNSQASFPAVSIEAAEPGIFSAGDVTFYGRYNGQNASDRREPLPTTYMPRLLNGGTYDNTSLLVWRETNASASRFACDTTPTWFPLDLTNTSGQDNQAVIEISNSGVGTALASQPSIPLATQSLDSAGLGLRESFSSLWMNLQHSQTVYAGSGNNRFGQAWVGSISQSSGRFADGIGAPALDSSCTNADFDFTSPGPTVNFVTF